MAGAQVSTSMRAIDKTLSYVDMCQTFDRKYGQIFFVFYVL